MTDKKLLTFVSQKRMLDIMKPRHKCYIVYQTPNGVQLTRLIEPYVLGQLRSGNYAVRAYQVTGGSNTVGWAAWKIFRLDRILNIRDAGLNTEVAPSGYNPNDRTFRSIVYAVPAMPPIVKEPEEKLPKTNISKFPLWEWILSIRKKNKK